jgi:hypothetical protein
MGETRTFSPRSHSLAGRFIHIETQRCLSLPMGWAWTLVLSPLTPRRMSTARGLHNTHIRQWRTRSPLPIFSPSCIKALNPFTRNNSWEEDKRGRKTRSVTRVSHLSDRSEGTQGLGVAVVLNGQYITEALYTSHLNHSCSNTYTYKLKRYLCNFLSLLLFMLT